MSEPMAYLYHVKDGKDIGCYKLRRNTTVVGRGPGCDIRITDLYVSRQHLRIRFEQPDQGHHLLVFENNENPTEVQGKTLEPGAETVLENFAVIKIADVRLVFATERLSEAKTVVEHIKNIEQRGVSTCKMEEPPGDGPM